MPPSTPSPRAWSLAIGYGGFAYAVHKLGAMLLFYQQFIWFQLLTHFLSASALTLLLLRAGQTLGLTETTLVVAIVGGVAIGALSWELVEYFDVFPWLHWWGLPDSLLDVAMDTAGLAAVLIRHRNDLPALHQAMTGAYGQGAP